MPVMECSTNGKAGYKYGEAGTCYTHDGSDSGKARAKQKAVKQAIAVGGGKAPTDLSETEVELSETKLCAACGSRYSRDRFTPDQRTQDGLSKVCVNCRFDSDRSFAGTTDKSWDGSASRFTDEQYKRSCLIDRGGDASVKERCSLPVLEPDGTINTHALAAAAAVLSSAGGAGSARGNRLSDVSSAQIASARSKLKGYYRKAGLDVPENLADRSMAELETVNLDGVPILAAGGPYHGEGSPDEGDSFDDSFLHELASAYDELRHEVKIPIKVGHSRSQKLLKNSGLWSDEMPAAGWVENLRVSSGKLLADLRKVPKKIADLIDSGAFRTRSVEMSKVTSQTHDGKEFPVAVTALALLGAKAPAVRTLDDIITAYYADRDDKPNVVELIYEDQPADTEMRTADYAGEVIWNAESGASDWQADLAAVLNEAANVPDGDVQPYWVQDIDQVNRKAIVCDYRSNAYWVIPFAVGDAGDPQPAPFEQWTLAEQAWVAADGNGASNGASQTPAMPNTGDLSDKNLARKGDTHDMDGTTAQLELTDEQVAVFAEQFGITEDDADKKRAAVLEKFEEFSAKQETTAPEPAEPDPAEPSEPAPAEPAEPAALSQTELKELQEKAALGERAFAEAKHERVEGAIGKALRQGRIDPATVQSWRDMAEADEGLFIKQLVAQPVNIARMRAFGSDVKPDATTTNEDELYRAYAGATGVPAREAVSK